ncbi:hypothetical protein CFC21_061613, partial [Triticum aestivum]
GGRLSSMVYQVTTVETKWRWNKKQNLLEHSLVSCRTTRPGKNTFR